MTSSIDSRWHPHLLGSTNTSSTSETGPLRNAVRRQNFPNRFNHPVPPSERPDTEHLHSASLVGRRRANLIRYETLVTSGRLYARGPVVNNAAVSKQRESVSGWRVGRERVWTSFRSSEHAGNNSDEDLRFEPALPTTFNRDVVRDDRKNVDFNENIVSAASNVLVDNQPSRLSDQVPEERACRVLRLQWNGDDDVTFARGNRSTATRLPTMRHFSATAVSVRRSRSTSQPLRSVSGDVRRDRTSRMVETVTDEWPLETAAWRLHEKATRSGTTVEGFYRDIASGCAFPRSVKSHENLRKSPSRRRTMYVSELNGVAGATTTTMKNSRRTAVASTSALIVVGHTLLAETTADDKGYESDKQISSAPNVGPKVEASSIKSSFDGPLSVGQLVGVVGRRGKTVLSDVAGVDTTTTRLSRCSPAAAAPADDVAQMMPDDDNDDDVTMFPMMASPAVHRVEVRFIDANKTSNGDAARNSPGNPYSPTNGKTWHSATSAGGSASWSVRRSLPGSASIRHPQTPRSAQPSTAMTNGSRTPVSVEKNPPPDTSRRLDYRRSPLSNLVQSSPVQQRRREASSTAGDDDRLTDHSSPPRHLPLVSVAADPSTDAVSPRAVDDAEQPTGQPVVEAGNDPSSSATSSSRSPPPRNVVLSPVENAVAFDNSPTTVETVSSSDVVEKVTSNDGIVTQPAASVDDVAPACPDSSEDHDGQYFLSVVEREEHRIKSLCSRVENDLNDAGLPDEAAGKIRSAIGKASLLTNKKFNQFRELCHKNLTQDSDEPFPTTCQDLEGFWDLVMIQVDDVIGLFAEIDSLKKNGWADLRLETVDNLPSSPTLRLTNGTLDPSPSRPKVVKSKSVSKRGDTSLSPQTNSKSDAAVKSREEARKRLLAAKAAGRQRKASVETESDDVQIFVA